MFDVNPVAERRETVRRFATPTRETVFGLYNAFPESFNVCCDEYKTPRPVDITVLFDVPTRAVTGLDVAAPRDVTVARDVVVDGRFTTLAVRAAREAVAREDVVVRGEDATARDDTFARDVTPVPVTGNARDTDVERLIVVRLDAWGATC